MRETAADAAIGWTLRWGYPSEHLGPSPTAWGFLAVWQPASKIELAGDPRLTHLPGGGTMGLVYQWGCVISLCRKGQLGKYLPLPWKPN